MRDEHTSDRRLGHYSSRLATRLRRRTQDKAGPFRRALVGSHTTPGDQPGGRREIVDDGCCNRVVTARFRILRVNGTPSNAVARITFSVVRLDKAVCRENHIRPFKSGQVGTLRLSRGVVTDDLTTVTFCAENVDKCGL